MTRIYSVHWFEDNDEKFIKNRDEKRRGLIENIMDFSAEARNQVVASPAVFCRMQQKYFYVRKMRVKKRLKIRKYE